MTNDLIESTGQAATIYTKSEGSAQIVKGTNALSILQIPEGSALFRLVLTRQTDTDQNGLWLSDDEIEIVIERSKDGGKTWEPSGGSAIMIGGQRKRLTNSGEVQVSQDYVQFGISQDGWIYRPLIVSKQVQVLQPQLVVVAPDNLIRPIKKNSVGVVDTDYASSSSASSLTTPSITNTGSNTLATLRLGADVSAGAPSAVKWGGSGGASLAEIGAGVVGTVTYPEAHAYYKIAPSTSGAQTFYAAFSGAGNCYITGGIRDNVDQSTPIHGSLITDYQYNADITLTVPKVAGEIVEGVAFACDNSEDGMYTSLSGDAVVSNDVDLLYCAGSSGHSNSTGTSKTFVTTGSYTDADVVGLAYAIKEASGGGGNTNYSLTCSAGSYSYTGVAALFHRTRALACAAGSYTYAGQAATFSRARKLTCDAGSYTYTGQSANLLRPVRSLPLAAGSYTYSGQSALFNREIRLNCEAGSYTYTGKDSTLTHATAGNYTLVCNAGSYTYIGQATTLKRGIKLSCEAGSYSYTGQNANLLYTTPTNYSLDCEVGSYTYVGKGINFLIATNSQIKGGKKKGKKKPDLYQLPFEYLEEPKAEIKKEIVKPKEIVEVIQEEVKAPVSELQQAIDQLIIILNQQNKQMEEVKSLILSQDKRREEWQTQFEDTVIALTIQ